VILGWRLTDAERREWLERLLASGRRVIAPTHDGELLLFRPIASPDEAVLDYGNTRWSPKEHLFPRSEELFSYRLTADEVKLEQRAPEAVEQVLFGLRPCDAAGLARLDSIFLDGDADAAYAERRSRTFTVSLACETSRPECFCTAVGGSPSGTDGSDLQLVRLDGIWLLRALTDKGVQLVETASAPWEQATDEDWATAKERQRAVEAEISQTPLAAEWAGVLEGAFGHPLWAAVGEHCLGCGVCAYVCPSCSCFEVDDNGSAFCGTRCRLWDSCGFASFTKHASGHNPRPDQPSRYRQRVLHKFAYYPLEHGSFMCVGCGRCTVLCPVGLDIQQTVRRVVQETLT